MRPSLLFVLVLAGCPSTAGLPPGPPPEYEPPRSYDPETNIDQLHEGHDPLLEPASRAAEEEPDETAVPEETGDSEPREATPDA